MDCAFVLLVHIAVQQTVTRRLDVCTHSQSSGRRRWGSATGRQRPIGRFIAEGFDTYKRMDAPARGGLHDSEACRGNAELKWPFDEEVMLRLVND
jgi:hypothetical protein